MFQTADGTCGQSDLHCTFTKYAKAAEKVLQDGKCTDHGYTVKTNTQTKTHPVFRDIVITTYTQPLATQSICSLFQIADGTCGQSDLDCTYTKYAKAAEKALQDCKCADQGYTVKTGTQTKTYPVVGDIVITTYTKALATQSICCLFQIADGTCGQSDLDCSYTKYDKAAKKYAIMCHKYISLGSEVAHRVLAQT